jgi:hypothetical protein
MHTFGVLRNLWPNLWSKNLKISNKVKYTQKAKNKGCLCSFLSNLKWLLSFYPFSLNEKENTYPAIW